MRLSLLNSVLTAARAGNFHLHSCMAFESWQLPCRLPGDKVDIWLCRYNGLGPANFWGFKQLSYRCSLSQDSAWRQQALYHLIKGLLSWAEQIQDAGDWRPLIHTYPENVHRGDEKSA